MPVQNATLTSLSTADRQLVESWLIDFDKNWHDGRLAEQGEGSRRRHAASGSTDDELLAQQVRLDLIGERVGWQVHGRGQRLNTGRPALEDADQRFQITAILLVETLRIDLGHGQRRLGDVEGDFALVFAGSEMARPP